MNKSNSTNYMIGVVGGIFVAICTEAFNILRPFLEDHCRVFLNSICDNVSCSYVKSFSSFLIIISLFFIGLFFCRTIRKESIVEPPRSTYTLSIIADNTTVKTYHISVEKIDFSP